MPELPEVETIIRNLREGSAGNFALPGCEISGFTLHWKKTLAVPDQELLRDWLPGQKVVDIQRRGKYLLLVLNEHAIIFHLRMSGFLASIHANEAENFKHIRFELNFQGGGRLIFNDPRKFGRIWVTRDPQDVLKHLGPEPLNGSLDADEFHRRLQGSQRAIKPLLLDQSFLAGLGNIYTDEALHLAGIHPLTPAKVIDHDMAERLLSAIRTVLLDGIRRSGASIDWVYRGGEYQNVLRVYGRVGLPCRVCGASIQRLVVGQRGTHICPVCQTLRDQASVSTGPGKKGRSQ